MLHAPFILADNADPWVTVLFFIALGVFWVIKQVASAATGSTKKPVARPRPPAAAPLPASMLQLPARPRPSAMTIGRPGGPATSLQDARRLAQTRALQARAAQAARLAAVANPSPRPAPPRVPPAMAQPTVPAAPARPAPARRAPPSAAPTATKPHPRLRPILTPQSLRSQFILTEIIGPPVTLRE